MSNREFIKTSINSAIWTLTVSRTEALNALNFDILSELTSKLQKALQNSECRCIILTGEGEKAFVAGADIKELAQLNPAQATEMALRGQKLFKTIENSPKPVIAAINGFALGGGCEIAMACHIRVASENAKFGQPEVNLGTIPGYGGTQRLAQLLGRGKALELLLTGDMINAAQALSLGLVNHVEPTPAALMDYVNQLATKISTKAPVAVRNIIASVNAGFGFEDAGYKAEADLFGDCAGTEDFREGTSAFIEKRKANFKGK